MSDIKYSYDQINFHKTFAPQDSYLTAIMELASQGFVGTKEEISEITGIPTGKTSGKVVPHILYAQYMGLTSHTLANSKYSLSLTELGKLVLENDKYLQSLRTSIEALHSLLNQSLDYYNQSLRRFGITLDAEIAERNILYHNNLEYIYT